MCVMSGDMKSKDAIADIGIGCATQVALLVVLGFCLDTDTLTSLFVYMFILAIPVTLARVALICCGVANRFLYRLLGPVAMALAVAAAILKPVNVGEKEPGNGPDAPSAETKAAPSAQTSAKAQAGTNSVSKAEGGQKPETMDEVLAELDGLVGLQSVKEEVRKFAAFVETAERRKAAGLKIAPVSYHMVFTGNPGTGKTTVARIMARILRSLGVLKKGHLVETDRSGLVGQYLGETAVKANAKIDEALGGVLFIDEAYALATGTNRDYGNEAVATLLKRMEDDRDRLVVIIAGYTKEMQSFIEMNSGLKSRFNRYLDFPDYSAEDLVKIFHLNVKKNQYVLAPGADALLERKVAGMVAKRDRFFGNAREMRNLFEKAVERQAVRISSVENPTKDDLMTLTEDDLDVK